MRVEANKLVALDYTLRLDSGEVIDRSEKDEPLAFIYGSGAIVAGLERGLLGLEPGATAQIVVEPEDGYGPVRPELVQRLPRRHFPDDVAEGMTFQAQGGHGDVVLLVKQVEDESVLVDLNHPLAGKKLHFEVRIAAIREPTDEDRELLHGCGGGGGHHCGSCSCG